MIGIYVMLIGALRKILGIVLVTGAALAIGWVLNPEACPMATFIAFLGALAYFFADGLAVLTWQSHGLAAKSSPEVAFKALGAAGWLIAGAVLIWG